MFESWALQVKEGTASPLDAVAALAALTDEQVLVLTQDEALAVVELTQVAMASLAAVQALGIEAFTRREAESLETYRQHCEARGEPTRGIPVAEEVVPAMLAPALHIAPRTAATLVGETRTLVGELPLTFALARAGRLEMSRARTAASEAALVWAALRGEFDRELVHPDRKHGRTPLVDLTSGGVRKRAARTAVRVDPESAAARAELCRRDRFVRVTPGEVPGITNWVASLPSDASLLAWSAIEALAAEYVLADSTRSIGAARADAMTDLILERATITMTVDLVVPAPTPYGGGAPVPSAGEPLHSDDDTTWGGRDHSSATVSARSEGEASLISFPSILDPDQPLVGQARGAGHDEARGSLAEIIYLCQVRTKEALLLDGRRPNPLHRLHRQRARPAGAASPAGHVSSVSSVGAFVADAHGASVRTLSSIPAPTDCHVGVAQHRVGIVLNASVTAWLADPDTRIRLHEADPVTGTLLRHDPRIYRPGASLARAVRARDGHCRFPGCTTDAGRCHLDHVTRFPDGPTALHNLNALCSKHHAFKHHAGWALTMSPDGTCTWTSPLGRAYVTRPTSTHDLAA